MPAELLFAEGDLSGLAFGGEGVEVG